jgi:hypothetical protein
VLTPLDVVDWSGLTHAFGEADDIPGLIEQLSDDDWADAVDDLFASLLDQGRVYPATVAAVPFLVQVALDEDAPGRLGALQVLAGIAEADGNLAGPEPVSRLWALAADADPEVRIAVYQVARSLGSTGMLRERLAAEEDASARVELVRALGTAGSSEMLAVLLEQEHDEAVFAVAWSLLVADPDRPEVVDHLVRLWPTQARGYPVAGGDDPVGALAREAGIHAVPVLFRLAQETGTPVGDLAWAWHDLVRSRRDALEPALAALLALTERGEDVEDLLGTLLPMLPVAGSGRAQAGDRLVRLVERAGPATPETQAALAVALFGLRDPRWVVPALAATAAEQPPYVTVGGSSLEFAAALGEFGPFGSAEPDLVDVALAAITAWPATVDGWAGLLAGRTLSAGSGRRVVEALLTDGIGGVGAITSKAVTRLLARIAAVPAAFDAATLPAVRELPVPGGEAGAWLLVTRARLDPGDPGAFARAWRMGEMGEGEDELLRIWAGHPSPELELVCQDLVARTNWGTFRSRAVQVVAMEVLAGPALAVGPAPAGRIESVWPVLLSLLGVAGDVRADAVALGNRLVGVRPDLRPQWISCLRNLAESNDFVTLIALEALQRLAEISPDQALDRALTGVNVVAGTRRAAPVARVAARVVRDALADRPDLRPVATAGLARLIEGAERVVAPAEIATDTGLVRNLREACAG